MKLSTLIVSSLPIWGSAHPGKGRNGEPCPFLNQDQETVVLRSVNRIGQSSQGRHLAVEPLEGDGGIPQGGYEAVMEDLKVLLTDNQPDIIPGDFNGTEFGPHYGGLFVRLAWHCSGTYRQSDGRGGCDGGRIRFAPEATWMDNGNLNKALELLKPIKMKYGTSLSWGDLIILSGTVAIESMGGTILGFCGGRVDVDEGDYMLGPSEEQEAIAPCRTVGMDGKCLSVEGTALGPTTLGLIYVDPAGPKGFVRDTVASGADIRRAFTRMGFDDTESVSLIGGGHAFGKAHGDPDGIMTSGFEGQWTTRPTEWTNEFFRNLFAFNWINSTSPAGQPQFAPEDGPADLFMLTTDLALRDDQKYRPISELYRDNITILEADFAASWYRLTTQDMGPTQVRCLGNNVPPPQYWENALPPSPETLPDYIPIRKAIQSIIDEEEANSDAMINLAYRCASTYRSTDRRGGCNGAKIRHPPESTWESNAGTAEALAKLEPVKTEFPDASYADLIVLAGITALESETEDLSLPFCGGYVDADNAMWSDALAPRIYTNATVTVRDDFLVKGLTVEEGVALYAREMLGTTYFMNLKTEGDNMAFSDLELALLEEEFGPVVEKFATDKEALMNSFKSGWTKLMTADRYKNYRENACTGVSTPTLESMSTSNAAMVSLVGVSSIAIVMMIL